MSEQGPQGRSILTDRAAEARYKSLFKAMNPRASKKFQERGPTPAAPNESAPKRLWFQRLRSIPIVSQKAVGCAPVSPPTRRKGWLARGFGKLPKFGRRARAAELGDLLTRCSYSDASVFAAQLVDIAAGARGVPALTELARHWVKLPDEAREATLSVGAARWAQVAQILIDDQRPDVRRSAAMFAVASGEPMLMRALPSMLRDPQPGVARAAESALVRLAKVEDRHTGHPRPAGFRETAERVIAQAAIDYPEHRRPGALLAVGRLIGSAALLAEVGEPLRSWLKEADHPVHHLMRSVIRRSEDASMRMCALVWLRVPALAGACRDRLIRAATVQEHEEVLSRAHLLANPARLEALRCVVMPAKWLKGGGAVPGARALAGMTIEARSGLATWLESVPMPPKLHDQAVALLLGDESAAVRHSAARSLARLAAADRPGARGQGCVVDLCFDEEARVARTAIFTLSRRRGALIGDDAAARVLERLARSPHDVVRAVSDDLCGRIGGAWDAATPAGRLAAHRLLRGSPDVFIARLRESVGAGPVASRIVAIRMAVVLRSVGDVELELLRIACAKPGGVTEGMERLVATAAAALSELMTEAAEAALRACLTHTDDRVRANALEGLCRRARRRGGIGAPGWLATTILELKGDRHHRVCAGAAWALMQADGPGAAAPVGGGGVDLVEAGMEALVRMIADDRCEHRIAGLWLAERLAAAPGGRLASRWGDHLAGRLAQVIESDPDDAVRERAARFAGRLIAEVRRGWSDRAGFSRATV
jgi:hypothetical protein